MKKLFFIYLVANALFISKFTCAQNWQNPINLETTAGVGGTNGEYNSMLIVNGRPAIACKGRGDLLYWRANDSIGTTWSDPVVIDSIGQVGRYTSLQIINGYPAISYYDFDNGNLKYVRATDSNGTTWSPPVTLEVSGNVGEFTSLQLINGKPAISYYDRTNGNLKFIRANDSSGTSWALSFSVDFVGDVGQYCSLKTVNGFPSISYYDITNGNLKFVRSSDSSGNNWITPVTVFATGDVGQFTSLQIVNGKPAISYQEVNGTAGYLKYVRAGDSLGNFWSAPISLDLGGNVGMYNSLQIINGNPAISYFDYWNSSLKYIRANNSDGTAWGTPVVIVSWGLVGSFTSLLLIDGKPSIAYHGNDNLNYVRSNDFVGGTWQTPVSLTVNGAVGQYPSATIIGGYPAAAYYDYSNSNLKYVRATDSFGISWSLPITIDASGELTGGAYSLSLKVINGHPAVSYFNSNYQNLRYIRANDSLGTSWPATPVIVDPTLNVGSFSSLKLVNGHPAISYYHFLAWNDGDLKYVRSNDSFGNSWPTPIIVDAVGDVGRFNTLEVVNGKPSIAYFNDTNDDLKFVRSNDTNGSVWPSPVNINTNGDVGYYPSLCMINGIPAVSYSKNDIFFTNNAVIFSKSNDSTGSSWNQIILDTIQGSYTSMQIINGNPAIAYNDLFSMMFIRANQPSGFSWSIPVQVSSYFDYPSNPSMVALGTTGAGIVYTSIFEDFPYFITGLPCSNISPTAPILTSSNDSICPGTSTLLNVVSGDLNSADSWRWYKDSCGGSPIGTGFSLEISPAITTTYFVRGEGGCINSGLCDSIIIYVLDLPVVNLGPDIMQCIGIVNIDAGNSGSQYEWSTNETSQIISTSSSSNIFVTVTDDYNCSNSDTIQVTLSSPPIVNLGNDITQCGGFVLLNAGNPGATYSWTPSASSQTYTAANTGTYIVFVTMNNCSNSDTVNITINPLPDISTILNGVTISANQNGASYQWLDCNNNFVAIPGETNQTFTATSIGNYSVSITLNNCTDTSACRTINSNGISDLINSEYVIIYPNPNNGDFTIESTIIKNFIIVNGLGEIIQNLELNNNQLIVENLSEGIYFLIGQNNKEIIKQKILIISE